MTIAVDWDVKNQTKPKYNQFKQYIFKHGCQLNHENIGKMHLDCVCTIVMKSKDASGICIYLYFLFGGGGGW